MSLILETAEGFLREIAGYMYAPPAGDAKSYEPAASVQGGVPGRVDLRPYMTAIEDQRGLSSCVANAVAGAYEYLVKRHQGDASYDVSRLFIYYNAREHAGDGMADDGVVIRHAIESLGETGACSEETWPYSEGMVNTKPSQEAYDEGARFLVEDVVVVPTDLDTWKQALAEGNPIIFGLRLYKSFDKFRTKGLVPSPSSAETSRDSHSGHAMLAVGYSDVDEVFIVRNSWGTDWGDAGYCYIPYDYLINDEHNFRDSWVIRRLEAVAVDEENTWFNDDVSVLTEFDSELARMDDASYRALLDDLGDVALETRIAILQLCVAGADEEITQPELVSISEYLTHIFSNVGSSYDTLKVLHRAQELMVDESIFIESVEILGRHFSTEALASMVKEMAKSAQQDGLHAEEQNILDALIQGWQVDPSFVTTVSYETRPNVYQEDDSDHGDDSYDDGDDDDDGGTLDGLYNETYDETEYDDSYEEDSFEEPPVVEEPVYEEPPVVEEPVYEPPVVEEPVYEEPPVVDEAPVSYDAPDVEDDGGDPAFDEMEEMFDAEMEKMEDELEKMQGELSNLQDQLGDMGLGDLSDLGL